MADVELIPATPDSRVSLETVSASQDPASDPRGEHEASDVVDQDPNTQVEQEIVQDNAEPEPGLDERVKDVHGDLQQDAFTEPGLASITEASKKADVPSKRTTPASKDKATVLAKSPSGKVNSSTSADKKVRWTCFIRTLASY